MGGDIGAHVVVHARRSVGDGLFQIDDGGQLLEVEGDICKRILGDVAALRDHNRQHLADVPHLVLGKRHLGALIEDGAGDRRRRHQQRTGRPIGAEIRGGVDRDHAGAFTRGGNVDRADAGVRDIAAQERRVQHARKLDIVDEQRLAAQESGVLVAFDRCAEAACRHAVSPAAVRRPASRPRRCADSRCSGTDCRTALPGSALRPATGSRRGTHFMVIRMPGVQ